MSLVDAATQGGARLKPACSLLGLTSRSVQRWRDQDCREDRRCGPRHRPANSLSEKERANVLAILQSKEYRNLPPAQVVVNLADQGRYVASESTMYRLLREQVSASRPDGAPTRVVRAPRRHVATAPNQVWCWDITLLPTSIRGCFFCLYLVVDLFSRRIMGFEVRAEESALAASALIRRLCDEHGVDGTRLVLHSDNGSAMRGSTMLETLRWLGITPSFSRPHVSDDNAYIEALFRTLKYRPATPARFAALDAARVWAESFMDWYNNQHRHSGIRYVTPEQRYSGKDVSLLAARHDLYQTAQARHPKRWIGPTRNWTRPHEVLLNHSKDRTFGGAQ